MNKKSDHPLKSEGLLLLAAAVCSFSFQVPALQASSFILEIDRGYPDEVPEVLNVFDHVADEVTFQSPENHPREPTMTEAPEISYEHFGHGTRRLAAIADVVGRDLILGPPPLVTADSSFSEAGRHFICSMRRAQVERSDGVTKWLAALLSERLGRPTWLIEDALKNEHFCDSSPQPASMQTTPLEVHLKRDGVLISSNPVWNTCVGGGPITKALIAGNRDVTHHRRGHLHKDIPYSCRDYHRGNNAVWHHPDFPDLEVTLDDRGRLIGGLLAGYIAVRDTQVVVGRESGIKN